ncbi:hypothetical protein BDP27DRAFT_1402405 [Rhodocollybia butyracea]|uniref:DUF6699 domain-containing protein n=1 Tax=Rhodocollybia butyracea TaxID=206335 RepID=A0A9P5U873_9AGAR|nr:hypothetical protein BDP27DRAFT_1402405 [Rhodocollybia butyracea]
MREVRNQKIHVLVNHTSLIPAIPCPLPTRVRNLKRLGSATHILQGKIGVDTDSRYGRPPDERRYRVKDTDREDLSNSVPSLICNSRPTRPSRLTCPSTASATAAAPAPTTHARTGRSHYKVSHTDSESSLISQTARALDAIQGQGRVPSVSLVLSVMPSGEVDMRERLVPPAPEAFSGDQGRIKDWLRLSRSIIIQLHSLPVQLLPLLQPPQLRSSLLLLLPFHPVQNPSPGSSTPAALSHLKLCQRYVACAYNARVEKQLLRAQRARAQAPLRAGKRVDGEEESGVVQGIRRFDWLMGRTRWVGILVEDGEGSIRVI